MSLFIREDYFESELNGKLVLRRHFLRGWCLSIPEGEFYSSSYLEKVWRKTLNELGKNFLPRDILVLGCGAGCILNDIQKRWPESQVDALDFDPIIIEIGHKIYENLSGGQFNFVISEADLYTKNLSKKYDLMVLDIFVKDQPSELLKNKEFIEKIYNLLCPGGTVVVNFATQISGMSDEIAQAWQSKFSDQEIFSCHTNHLFLGHKSKIPPDYYNIYQARFWVMPAKKMGFEVITQDKAFFTVKKLPFGGLNIVTAIHCNVEPDIKQIKELINGHGIVVWSPLDKKFKPLGWRKLLFSPHLRGNGMVNLGSDYQKKWDASARRNLKKFESFNITIEKTTGESFIEGLYHSNLKASLIKWFIKMIRDVDREILTCWIARQGDEILGGLAVVRYDDISAHYVAYICEEGKKYQVGTGLINHWFGEALNSDIKYLNFGHVYQKGEERGWRDYSKFKRKFIDEEFVLEDTYFRVF